MVFANVDVSDDQIGLERAGGAEHLPVAIHDAGRAVGYEIAVNSRHVCAHDRHPALRGASDVAGASVQNQLRAPLRRRHTIVRRHEKKSSAT
jgi:hypothetical protein